ncbi:MAG: hypothetical protein HY836_14655 [Aquabacterium sp.]|uniref:hypothetical protein n=1 Tax=Aquabacterium sp. TaxID=1872578 RepID=UPI0025C0FD86|nr:hypothetical protein [Aquabacterium sp.]MBI5926828.1 hypothetical protein [Aquabacterium sp.]
MKTFKTRSNPSALSALTLAVFALVHTGASAAASDEELKKTKVYGDVSIAEDTSSSWGPWSNFEPPAAGPATSTNQSIVRSVELYRPLAQPVVPPVESIGLGCAGGSLCGFGVFSGNDSMNNSYTSVPPHAWVATGSITPAEQGLLPTSITLNMKALSEGASLLIPDSGPLTLGTDDYYDAVYSAPSSKVSGYEVYGHADAYLNDMAEQTLVAGVNISQYVRGESSGESESYSYQGRYGSGVLGFTTSDADMSALRANNATASYTGGTLDSGMGSVHVDVQFGAATWQATFNGGQDGKVGSYTPYGSTTPVLYGNVGFTAAGTISGVNLQSTSVGTNDVGASVSGYVRGAFFGPQAAAIGGVVDITKTMPAAAVQMPAAAAPQQARVASMVAEPSGYTNARYVAPFVAVNDKLLSSRDDK